MKGSTLSLVAVLLCSAITAYGQETMEKDSMAPKKDAMGVHKMDKKKMMHDGVMMKDGKMMMMKGGKSMEMEKEMTLGNGTKVMPDGKLMMKDGTTSMMKEGDMMDMKGMMMKKDVMKMKDKGMMKKGMEKKDMMKEEKKPDSMN